MPKINLNQIEEVEVETLPFRESRCQYITRKLGNMYDINKFDHPWSRFDKYYKLAYRILDNNINKSFDMAFHYYCVNSPKYLQYIFLREFENSWRCRNEYEIKDKKIIKNPYKKYWINKPTVYSWNYNYKDVGWKKVFEGKTKEYYKLKNQEENKKKKFNKELNILKNIEFDKTLINYKKIKNE